MAPCSPDYDRAEHLWILCFCAAIVLGSFVLDSAPDGSVCFRVPLTRVVVSLPPVCMSSRLLGISCPGCGLTRSFVAVAHGQLALAVRMNPVGPILFFLACLQLPYRLIEYFGVFRGSNAWDRLRQVQYPVMWIVLVGLIASWIWRMI
jgi:hypothetical protein